MDFDSNESTTSQLRLLNLHGFLTTQCQDTVQQQSRNHMEEEVQEEIQESELSLNIRDVPQGLKSWPFVQMPLSFAGEVYASNRVLSGADEVVDGNGLVAVNNDF